MILLNVNTTMFYDDVLNINVKFIKKINKVHPPSFNLYNVQNLLQDFGRSSTSYMQTYILIIIKVNIAKLLSSMDFKDSISRYYFSPKSDFDGFYSCNFYVLTSTI